MQKLSVSMPEMRTVFCSVLFFNQEVNNISARSPIKLGMDQHFLGPLNNYRVAPKYLFEFGLLSLKKRRAKVELRQ